MIEFINFLHKAFGITNDAAATVIITLITFFLGILITEALSAYKAYAKRENYRELLRINLISLFKGLRRQATGYEIFCKQLDINHIGTYTMTQTSISAIEVLKKLGYENLYDACFGGAENWFPKKLTQKVTAFSSIWGVIAYVEKFHSQSYTDFQTFLEKEGKINEQRNSNLGQAYKIVDEFRLIIHGERVPAHLGQYFNAIEDILLHLRRQPDYTMPKTANDLFTEKILELNRNSVDVIKEFGQVLHPVELNSFLLSASLDYKNQNNVLESYHHQFEHLSKGFFNSAEKIIDAYRILIQRKVNQNRSN